MRIRLHFVATFNNEPNILLMQCPAKSVNIDNNI